MSDNIQPRIDWPTKNYTLKNEDDSIIGYFNNGGGNIEVKGPIKSLTMKAEIEFGVEASISLLIASLSDKSDKKSASYDEESSTFTFPNEFINSPEIYMTNSVTGDNATWGLFQNQIQVNSTIQISCSTPDSQIYYTTDNSQPDSSKSLYSNQFEVESGTTIKAIAIKDGYINSDIAEYTVN